MKLKKLLIASTFLTPLVALAASCNSGTTQNSNVKTENKVETEQKLPSTPFANLIESQLKREVEFAESKNWNSIRIVPVEKEGQKYFTNTAKKAYKVADLAEGFEFSKFEFKKSNSRGFDYLEGVIKKEENKTLVVFNFKYDGKDFEVTLEVK